MACSISAEPGLASDNRRKGVPTAAEKVLLVLLHHAPGTAGYSPWSAPLFAPRSSRGVKRATLEFYSRASPRKLAVTNLLFATMLRSVESCARPVRKK